ncbi:MAG: response regulator transcription factor [Nocardioidaceae bacterium]
MSLTVAVVNDYEVVVHGVASMLRSYAERVDVVELDVNAEVASKVDIALYDTFAMSQGDRAAVAELVDNPGISKVVVYTWNLDAALERSSLRIGVAGYLSKRMTAAELVEALEQVHRGQVVVSTEPRRQALVGGDWPGREEGLTPRESEVLALITQGLSNAEITDRTGLSINSVKSYIRTCYRKIGATSRARAVIWGIDHGFQTERARTINPDIPGSS